MTIEAHTMTTNTYGGYTVDQLREFIRHHYDAEHGGDNIDELTNDSSASVKIVRDLLDAIEPQKDGELLRPIARWVYNAVRVNLDLLHGICSEFGCPQGEDVATWLRDRLSNEKSPAPEQASEATQQRSGMDRPFTEVVPAAEVIVDARAGDGNETSSKVAPRYTEWHHLVEQGQWTAGVPDWARDHDGRMNDVTAMRAVIDELAAIALRSPARTVAAWMRADDPSDCISDAKKCSMIEHNGLPGKRAAEKYSIALGVLAQAPVPAPAAIYQILTEDGAWLDSTREYYERVKSDPALARVVYSAPQPTAQAVGRAGLTDEQRAVMQDAVRSISLRADELKESNTALDGTWCDADEKAAYEAEVRLIERLHALLAAHPGQTEPRTVADADLAALLPGTYYMDPPDGGDISLLEQLRRMAKDAARHRSAAAINDEAREFLYGNLESIQSAIELADAAGNCSQARGLEAVEYQIRRLFSGSPEPRGEVASDDQRDGVRWRTLMKNGEPEVFVERTQRRAIQRTQPVAFSSPNLTGANRVDPPSEMWVKRYVMFAWWARENEHLKFIEAVDAISAGEIQ